MFGYLTKTTVRFRRIVDAAAIVFGFLILIATNSFAVDDANRGSEISFDYLADSNEYKVISPHLRADITVTTLANSDASTSRIRISFACEKDEIDETDLSVTANTENGTTVSSKTIEVTVSGSDKLVCSIVVEFPVTESEIDELTLHNRKPNKSGVSRLELVNDEEISKVASRWGKISDSDGKCETKATFDKLSITTPAGCYDLMPGNPLIAPFALNQIAGDFSFQIKVTGDFVPGKLVGGGEGIPYNGAGIIVWEDEKNFLRVERNAFWRFDGSKCTDGPLIEYWKDFRAMGENSGINHTDYFKGRSTWFNVQRKKQDITVTISHDGKKWEDVKTFKAELPDEIFVGVLSVNTSNEPFVVDFEDLSLRTDRLIASASYKRITGLTK